MSITVFILLISFDLNTISRVMPSQLFHCARIRFTYWQCGSWRSQRPQPSPSHHREVWAEVPFPFHSWRSHCSPVEIFCEPVVRVPFCSPQWFVRSKFIPFSPRRLTFLFTWFFFSVPRWVTLKPALLEESPLTLEHVLLWTDWKEKEKVIDTSNLC